MSGLFPGVVSMLSDAYFNARIVETKNGNGVETKVASTTLLVQVSILLKETRVCVCLQNWTNFCPYGLNSTPIST